MASPLVYVDADGCPVKEETIAAAHAFGLRAVFVSSQGHPRLEGRQGVELVAAGSEFQAADTLILQRISPGDVLVTSDLELARDALKKGAQVCGPKGALGASTIGDALELRDLYRGVRERGKESPERRARKGFSDKARSKFKAELNGMLGKAVGEGKNSGPL